MPSTDVSREAIEDVLVDAIANLGPARSEITREATFEDLDVDSLDLVEIAQIVETTWGVELDPQDFGSLKTVGEAFDLVVTRVS